MNAMLEQINAAGGAFVNFAGPMLVQVSVLILIILAIDLLLKKKVRAVFRYWLWMLVLAKLVLPVTLSSPFSLGYLIGDQLNAQVNVQEPAAELGFTLQGPLAVEGIDSVPSEAPEAVEDFGPASAEGVGQPVSVVAVSPLKWEGVVFLVWAAIVVAMMLMLLQRAFFVFGLVAQAKKAGGTMEDILERCKEKMGMRGKVGLKLSANATSPAVCGLFRPVILVPQDLEARLDGSEMRAVLMHELAHIRRGDLWVSLAQTVLQIVYFYNPLLWAANAVIRRVREQAVDEAVLVAMGEAARQYPQTLVNVAKLAFGRPALSLRLIGVVESKSALKGRVKRILERPLPKNAKLGIAGLIMVLLFGSVLLP
ncbi:MAG: M56 family metallopeptidase, partial [Sedimentisphaerales bacterium]|nr:M56 family metallopeptidase [Sedimentisphaerales bacterium]